MGIPHPCALWVAYDVRELWQKVYKGRDIDYIAIRSDAEDAEAQDGSAAPVVVESPWSQFTSECQRFWHPPRLDK